MRDFLYRSIAVAAACGAMTGCYLGKSPNAKTVAYVANGSLVAAGTLGIANAGGDEQAMLTTISAIPLVVGLIGIAVNLAVETSQPDPVSTLPAHQADGSATSITW